MKNTLEAIKFFAATEPRKIAISAGELKLNYELFSLFIDNTRSFLDQSILRKDGTVVIAIGNLPESWFVLLAARSMGLQTIAVQSPDALHKLGDIAIGCIVTSEMGPMPAFEQDAHRFQVPVVRLPLAIYEKPREFASTVSDRVGAMGRHILLSSGTTGVQKKMLIDAETDQLLVARFQSAHGLTRNSVSWAGNFGLWTLWGFTFPSATWSAGGSVVFMDDAEGYGSLANPDLTHAVMTPAMLMDVLSLPAGHIPFNPLLRLFYGGGPVLEALANAAQQTLTPHIVNSMGCTEVGPVAFTPVLLAEDLIWHQPLPWTNLQIVDERDERVPVGAMGRVRIGSFGNIHGYMGDPETSKEFFRDDFFYTGDLGILDANGRFALSGRAVDVLNIGGSKYPPGPIETACIQELGVEDACVLSVPIRVGVDQIHVVLQAAQMPEQARLQSVITRLIPWTQQIQSHCRPQLTRNSMGKVQRQSIKDDIIAASRPNVSQ